MSDTRPASIPDLSPHAQQIMQQFFKYHNLISCTFCCHEKPSFPVVEKEIEQAIDASTRGATTTITKTTSATRQPKKRSRVASDASNGSQKGTPIATPVKSGQIINKNSNNTNNSVI
ncbi:uncharacterized protein B0P05DRAFT_592653 [Gilbertella persicaria]|uniref:uncharacterized protein n=1 Tax=Gilbertella persicaria TaxID=101096 RepID=UPI00221F8128|nr:uncharacterized protein B0P05DRAFT_592653 [Gilbertella persicaria]KAI8047446.1 hypothetical protein B0P05DRAFT_592653 [Gilbertella persicaria]